MCPTTTKLLETVPLAGRIAGFNRQQPKSGIPLHSDGNNMWLTCQMGIKVPEGKQTSCLEIILLQVSINLTNVAVLLLVCLLTTCSSTSHYSGEKAWIRVGPETRHWKEKECLLYDTTYEHETMNESETEERVVLHVDFFNTVSMTPVEIEVMQYIYSLREEFMKAEGVAKVGKQIL